MYCGNSLIVIPWPNSTSLMALLAKTPVFASADGHVVFNRLAGKTSSPVALEFIGALAKISLVKLVLAKAEFARLLKDTLDKFNESNFVQPKKALLPNEIALAFDKLIDFKPEFWKAPSPIVDNALEAV